MYRGGGGPKGLGNIPKKTVFLVASLSHVDQHEHLHEFDCEQGDPTGKGQHSQWTWPLPLSRLDMRRILKMILYLVPITMPSDQELDPKAVACWLFPRAWSCLQGGLQWRLPSIFFHGSFLGLGQNLKLAFFTDISQIILLSKNSTKTEFLAVLEPVYVHVYRLKDSDLGFYHTGVGNISPAVNQSLTFSFLPVYNSWIPLSENYYSCP